MIKAPFIALLPLLVLSAPASAGTLEEDFANPPTAARPFVWWHWMGPLFQKDGITRDLEAMKAAGIGGATIFNITSSVQESSHPLKNLPWPENTYRGPAYWAAVAHAAAEAKRLGLTIGLHNTVGYSTTGGPWITPNRGMQRVVWSETEVEGGGARALKLEQPAIPVYRGWGGAYAQPITLYRDIGVVAVPAGEVVRAADVLDLSARLKADGSLSWEAPPGRWKLLRFGYAPTGATPHPVPDDVIGKTLEADKMSREQSEYHWAQVLDPLRAHLGANLGASFDHVLIDSYEAGPQTWTPGFREEFRRRKGYDPLPWMATLPPVLTGERNGRPARVIGSADETARFEFDFKEVVAELYRVNGWEPAAEKIHAAGLKLQFEPYTGPFDTVAGAALADLPMGEFWTGSGGGIQPTIVPAARAAGRRVIGAEAFTGLPQRSDWSETPASLRADADGAYVAGVNRLVLHHWVHQPFGDQWRPGLGMGWWGTHFGRLQTWQKPGREFFAYLGRIQALLQRGEQTVDVLSVARAAPNADIIPPHEFFAGLRVEDGRFVLPSGRRYPVMVVPHDGALTPEFVRRLDALVRAGGNVVCKRPQRSPSLQDYPKADAAVVAAARELWGEKDDPVRVVGKGRLYGTGDLALARRGQQIDRPLVSFAGETDGVRDLQRRDGDAEIFFVAHAGKQPARVTASFRVAGRLPEIWDPEDGSRRPAPNWRARGDRTEVDLTLEAVDAQFVIFRQPTAETGAQSPEPAWNVVQTLDGAWSVTFPGRAPLRFNRLTSWSEQVNPALRFFSGTATYERTLEIDPAWLADGRRLRLDLGSVRDLVEVRLNGRPLRVLWAPPYVIDITDAVKAGENALALAVTNTWRNRLIGDEQEPPDLVWGKERFFGRDKKSVGRPLEEIPAWVLAGGPRPSPGRQTFTNWNYFTADSALHPAGLLGPVKLWATSVKP